MKIISKISKYFICIILIITITLTPYLIGHYTLSKNLSISDWVSFYGGYLGAIIGIIGVIISIIYSSNEAKSDRINTLELAKEERRYTKMPYIKIEPGITIEDRESRDYPRLISYNTNNSSSSYSVTHTLLAFKNIGSGPIINFKININDIPIKDSSYKKSHAASNLTISLIDVNDSFEICMTFNEKDYIEYSSLPIYFYLTCEYTDILDNQYSQEIEFSYKINQEIMNSYTGYKMSFLNSMLKIQKPKILKVN